MSYVYEYDMLRYQSGSAVARGPAAPALSKINKIEWDQPNDTGVINPHDNMNIFHQ